jgi:integrase
VRREVVLGPADDPGSVGGLGYTAAVSAAMAWAVPEKTKIAASAKDKDSAGDVSPTAPSLREVLGRYVAARTRRNALHGRNAGYRLGRHLLSDTTLAATPIDRLSGERLQAWRNGLPAELSPATVSRLVSDLRAGIASGCPGGDLPPALRHVLRPVPGAATARDVQVLGEADLRRLLLACEAEGAEFARLVWVMTATGSRFSQVVRLRVADVQVTAGRIMMPPSHKGRPGKARGAVAIPVGADVIAKLAPALAGRLGHEVLLLTSTGKPWTQAGHLLRAWRRAVAAVGLPVGTIPYVLRHSSIVRQLTAGMPLRYVALLHDTGTAPIEKHYARYITGEIEQLARRAIIPLEGAEVIPLTPTVGRESR